MHKEITNQFLYACTYVKSVLPAYYLECILFYSTHNALFYLLSLFETFIVRETKVCKQTKCLSSHVPTQTQLVRGRVSGICESKMLLLICGTQQLYFSNTTFYFSNKTGTTINQTQQIDCGQLFSDCCSILTVLLYYIQISNMSSH